jgi:hypothetical protein
MLPVYGPFGVTVKLADARLSAPPAGPLRVYVEAGAIGVTAFDAAEAALAP